MSVMSNNGNTIVVNKDIVIINGVSYLKPGKGNNVTQCNDDIYINGYEFKNNKFKRTLKAFIECYLI